MAEQRKLRIRDNQVVSQGKPTGRYSTAASRSIFKTPWGWMGVAATNYGVTAVVLPKPSRRAAEAELGQPAGSANTMARRNLKIAKNALCRYLAGGSHALDLPIDLQGSSRFRRKVWTTLRSIPYGRVRSYGWVARKIGKRVAARAVGGACGANPVPLLIPCHRVVASNGSLGGFSGGLPVKRRLLRLEGIIG
jgi:methylated-DNA-[protein]-cysteine S-methyltransferase